MMASEGARFANREILSEEKQRGTCGYNNMTIIGIHWLNNIIDKK
jgi:hypothetical protein